MLVWIALIVNWSVWYRSSQDIQPSHLIPVTIQKKYWIFKLKSIKTFLWFDQACCPYRCVCHEISKLADETILNTQKKFFIFLEFSRYNCIILKIPIFTNNLPRFIRVTITKESNFIKLNTKRWTLWNINLLFSLFSLACWQSSFWSAHHLRGLRKPYRQI